ncbi:MAG: DNA polymerase III subunit gamma/tau [bacterium]
MSTLYRKYRPQTFENVIGQTHIIQTITNEISMGRVAQAYLFSGSRGVGKTTTARLLAKAMNCQNRKDGKFEPCEECLSCKEITGGRSIDVIEIDAASQTGVDNVRENIIENAQFKPTASKFKIFIIDEVHMLSNSSFNALLKTLEEPPAHAIFILATTELHKLPDTVISRCQRFNFKKIKFDDMLKRLEELAKSEGVKIDKDVLKRIINKSDGCLRDAESLLGQIFSLNIKKITTEDAQMILPTADAETVLNYVECLIQKNAGDAIRTVNHLGESGASLDQFAHDLFEILRLMIIGQS